LANLIDSHAHLDLLDDPAGALQASRAVGVSRIISVGIDLTSSLRAIEFAGENEEVTAAVGIHPHDSAQVNDDALVELKSLITGSENVIAVGETGLDFYRNRAPRDLQEAAFISHIELARMSELPIIVHSREANGEVLELLERFASGLTVILHCFSLCDHVELCAERGYFMSLAGNVTFANAHELRKAAATIPEKLLLTETDSPYLSPVPHRGQKNEPANVLFVLEEIARLRRVSPEELAASVAGNFQNAFGRAPAF